MLVLGVDTETTGLNVKTDRILEIGWCIYSIVRNTPMKLESYLIREDIRIPISQEVQTVTKIVPSDINDFGVELKPVLVKFLQDIKRVHAVVAHNGRNFDFPLIDAECARCGLEFEWPLIVDTSTDLPLNAYGKSASLTYMAADHGFLNPFPHRALTDVLTMMKILAKYDMNVVLERAASPRVVVKACVNFDNKDLAKAEGFRWQEVADMKFEKSWVKVVKDCDFEQLKQRCKFTLARLRELK